MFFLYSDERRALMKRFFSLFLTLSLALCLCACGEPEVIEKEVPVIPTEYVEYADIVDALVREDYDGAAALIDGLRPAPELTEAPMKTVELSMANFFDYFEYVEVRSVLAYDLKGEVKTVGVDSFYRLKDGIVLADPTEHPSEGVLSCELATRKARLGLMDMEELTWRNTFNATDYKENPELAFSSLTDRVDGVLTIPVFHSYYTDCAVYKNVYSQYVGEFELNGVTGTLLLAD